MDPEAAVDVVDQAEDAEGRVPARRRRPRDPRAGRRGRRAAAGVRRPAACRRRAASASRSSTAPRSARPSSSSRSTTAARSKARSPGRLRRIGEVASARVHIAMAKDVALRVAASSRPRRRSSSSCAATGRSPPAPSPASRTWSRRSVEGLRPEAVVILDNFGRPLSQPAGDGRRAVGGRRWSASSDRARPGRRRSSRCSSRSSARSACASTSSVRLKPQSEEADRREAGIRRRGHPQPADDQRRGAAGASRRAGPGRRRAATCRPGRSRRRAPPVTPPRPARHAVAATPPAAPRCRAGRDRRTTRSAR